MSRITRGKRISVGITPDIHDRFYKVCEMLGQSPATIASMAISEYVLKKENEQRQVSQIAQGVKDGMMNSFKHFMDNSDMMEKLFEAGINQGKLDEDFKDL